MRSLCVILLAAFIPLLLFGCEPGKPTAIDILIVESEYGSPTPRVGRHYAKWGLTITASVDSPVAGATEGTRYACTSWTGTGSVPSTGSTNSVTFVITQNSSITWQWTVLPIYVDGTNGDDANDGSSWDTAMKTIQAGLDAAANSGCSVFVADGTYTGTGNKNLDFKGKAIQLNSVGGAANCIIDCENSGRGFYFHSGETAFAVIEGFTIRNGYVTGSFPNNCGGGVYCENSSPTFTNCTISGNSAEYFGGGVDCYYSSPTFTNCTISGNSADIYGGGVRCYYSSPTLTNCTISGNLAPYYDGGGIYCEDSSPTFTNCTISGNSAVYSGGGVHCEYYSSPTFTNCTISSNTVSEGGGVYCENSSPTFTNCTIANNTAGNGGGVCCYSSGSPTFRNSIIWGNSATSIGHQIYTDDSGSSVTLSYSCYANGANDVTGSGTVTPDNCINTNPLFVGGGDYHLQGTSPCIDIGNNSYVPAEVATDLDGNPRILDGDNNGTATVDLGAYEYQP